MVKVRAASKPAAKTCETGSGQPLGQGFLPPSGGRARIAMLEDQRAVGLVGDGLQDAEDRRGWTHGRREAAG